MSNMTDVEIKKILLSAEKQNEEDYLHDCLACNQKEMDTFFQKMFSGAIEILHHKINNMTDEAINSTCDKEVFSLAISALQKQIPIAMNPFEKDEVDVFDNTTGVYEGWLCPSCHATYYIRSPKKYCEYCGQRIKIN